MASIFHVTHLDFLSNQTFCHFPEEPCLLLSFMYNVNGEKAEDDTVHRSRHKLSECNPSFLRALIEEKPIPIPLNRMVDPHEAETLRERVSNTISKLVFDCAGFDGLEVLHVVVQINLEDEEYVDSDLDDVELSSYRRMKTLLKNIHKSVAMVEKENELCAICLNEMRVGEKRVGEKVACTPCIHKFHHTCISRWFEKFGLCPLCRFNIDK